ncbi:hypothetical protein Q8A73_014823 [Channa argus]|nr:hypothetical protein Q8A73_014823 [Channa argus]
MTWAVLLQGSDIQQAGQPLVCSSPFSHLAFSPECCYNSASSHWSPLSHRFARREMTHLFSLMPCFNFPLAFTLFLSLISKHICNDRLRSTKIGSAFPDVCCSFDLLLQLKLHPPPASLTCCHTHALTRSSIHHHNHPVFAGGLQPQLSSPDHPTATAIHQLTSLTTAAQHATRPLSISPTLPLTFAFDPVSLHVVLSVLNLLVAGCNKIITSVACSTAPNQKFLVILSLWLVIAVNGQFSRQ